MSRESRRLAQIKRRFQAKMKIIKYLGSKCVDCGTSENRIHWTAFQCNHRIPKEKSFSISDNKCISWAKLKPELDKCDLVCANCHSRITWEQRQRKKGVQPQLPHLSPRLR